MLFYMLWMILVKESIVVCVCNIDYLKGKNIKWLLKINYWLFVEDELYNWEMFIWYLN